MGDNLALHVRDIDGRPLVLGLEHDCGLDHVHRRGVGGGLGAAHLAENVVHLGKGANHLVGLLEDFACLGGRDAGKRRRHVEQVALVERRHELGAEILVGKEDVQVGGKIPQAALGQALDDPRVPGDKDPDDDHHGGEDDQPAPFDHKVDARMVEPDENAVDGVFLLRSRLAANEQAHEHGRQGDGQ